MQGMTWSDRLATLVGPVLAETPLGSPPAGAAAAWAEAFRDERGNRRRSDGALLARLLGESALPAAPSDSLDVRLWTDAANSVTDAAEDLVSADGPLAPLADGVIEVWTESELSGIQALRSLALAVERHDLAERALRAAAWHVDNTQPDNATNQPWAINVFAELASRPGTRGVEAEMYAQTLVHNALFPRGRPERFAACVMLEASRGLLAIGL
ncbi:MAG: hypothetical protein AAF108_05835 [Planctomycetota bacterium]